MKKIFRKHVNYDYIKKKTTWLRRGRFSYEGYMHGRKIRLKLFRREYQRMFFNHWAINTRRRKL